MSPFVTQNDSPRQASNPQWVVDNALDETINGLYKAELIHKRAPWKTRESVELASLEWVSWFNHQRLLEPIGYIAPAEAEAQYYCQLATTADAV